MKDSASGAIFCFGEVLIRLTPTAGTRLSQSSTLQAHVGGSEANVGALLAQLGHAVEAVTVLPSSSLGDLCEGELRRLGIGTRHVRRAGGRIGLYFLDPLPGAAEVHYDRRHSAFAESADSFDWPVLASTARWFHLSGINLALGGKPAEAALTAAEAMLATEVPISFDVNHRASLWDGRFAGQIERVKRLARMAEVLFASSDDIARMLQQEFANEAQAIDSAFAGFGRLRCIASTRRSTNGGRQLLSARVHVRGDSFETEPAMLWQAIDRIGSGDAFAGAVIDGLMRGLAPAKCASQGLAAAVMKHSVAGDRWIGTRAELEEFDPFGAGDVRR